MLHRNYQNVSFSDVRWVVLVIFFFSAPLQNAQVAMKKVKGQGTYAKGEQTLERVQLKTKEVSNSKQSHARIQLIDCFS
jgi:hypothetical protein